VHVVVMSLVLHWILTFVKCQMLSRSGRFHPVHLEVQWSSLRHYPNVGQTVNITFMQKGCSACWNIPGSLIRLLLYKTARSRSWYVQRVRIRCSKPPLHPCVFMERWLMEGSYELSFVQNVYSLINTFVLRNARYYEEQTWFVWYKQIFLLHSL